MDSFIEVSCADIKRRVSKIYKQMTGKGPEETIVMINDYLVSIQFKGALSKLEKSLLQVKGKRLGEELVEEIRRVLAHELKDLFVPSLEDLLGYVIRDGLSPYNGVNTK